MDINDLQKSWEVVEAKEHKDLQEYSDAQHKVIVDLQSKNIQLKEKLEHLELLLQNTVPTIGIQPNLLGVSNELLICETQISLLKERAIVSELTIEDAKKLQIYTDVLEKIRKKPKTDQNTEKMSDDDLVKIIQIHGTN